MWAKFSFAALCRVFSIASALVSGLAMLRLYPKYLKPETYGVVAAALNLLSYLPYLDGGFRTTVNRKILASKDGRERGELIRFCQTFYCILGISILVVSALLMAGFSWTEGARDLDQGFLFFVALGLAATLTVMSSSQLGLLLGLEAQSNLYLVSGISSWVTLGTFWLALRHGKGIWAFPLSTLASAIVTYVLAFWLIRRIDSAIRFFSFDLNPQFWSYLKSLGSDAWGCFRSQVSIVLLFSVDLILVWSFSSLDEVAVYAILSRLFGIVRTFLQITGEVAWPIIAQKNEASNTFTTLLLRINGWVYGGVMGVMSVNLVPFLGWFWSGRWATPDRVLVWLMVARFLITGVSSLAAYFLIGLGDFRTIARYIERELVAAVIFSIPLGLKFGVNGVALGFLLATPFGTLVPIFVAYAKAARLSAGKLMATVWWRVVLGFAASLVATVSLTSRVGQGLHTIWTGFAGAAAALLVALIISFFRLKTSNRSKLMSSKFVDIVKTI